MMNSSKLFFFKKGKNIESKLIRLICLLLILLFVFIAFLYYTSIQGMYSEQLVKSNNGINEQVAISFETIMKQINGSLYKIPLYDNDLLQLLNNSPKDSFYEMNIYKKLDSILLGNEYLFSSYLYLLDKGIVFDSEFGYSYTMENFPDQAALAAARKEIISVLDPRLVDSRQGKKLLISVVLPVPLSTTEYKGVLVVNIDAGKLYYDILKQIKAEKNMNFFIYNSNNTIVIAKDDSQLFRTIPVIKPNDSYDYNALLPFSPFYKTRNITSLYYSKALNWNFVLETAIAKPPLNYISRTLTFVLYFIVLLILSLFIAIWIVKYSTRPIKNVLSTYAQKLWKDFILDNNVNPDEIQEQLTFGNEEFKKGFYAIILLEVQKNDIHTCNLQQYLYNIESLINNMSLEFNKKVIYIDKNLTAIIINFDTKSSIKDNKAAIFELSKLIYESMDMGLKPDTYIGVSLPHDSLRMLPKAYWECVEALNYKIMFNSHILQFYNINGQKQPFVYSYELERQLVNNLIVGNVEASHIFVNKFFESLTDYAFSLSDSEIKNYIYQLQTSILRNISGLPVPVKIDSSMNILNLFDLQEIKEKVSVFIEKIVSEINKSDDNGESNLFNNIIEYIDKKYMYEYFNLNRASDDLNLSRNYLARLIKEKTNDSFKHLVNKKRISMAKQLLNDKNIAIENIAHQVGFNYSHYFIKVFKDIEGITPRQYRDRLMESHEHNLSNLI